MDFLSTHCSLMALRTPQVQRNLGRFRCGDDDLDDFFRKDALAYEQALFGKTYAFVGDETHGIASMFTVSNGSLQARREEPLRTRMMCCDLFAYANELRA